MQQITKRFGGIVALKDVSFDVHEGEIVGLMGPNGAGKTTLLNLIGSLDTPTGGHICFEGRDLAAMTRRARAELRLRSLGFVFQAYNLIPVLTARENVEFVLELQGAGRDRRARAEEVLAQLGLRDLADRRASELSGGEQQRVAVARAVVSRPRLVLADEPTANLDTENAEALMRLMERLNRERGTAFVFATHDARVVAHARRVVTLRDGCLLNDERRG
ncbi:MAG: ABC transporter ATP-binding protein [Armatimonadota bacterium]|nr:ABC transporter ATP-binding protein [Armatimonadota bacterium]